MQTKKRAKPVKFGKEKKEKKESPKVLPAKIKDAKEASAQDKAVKDVKAEAISLKDPQDKKENSEKEVEAHFSSVQTLDITEKIKPKEEDIEKPDSPEADQAATEEALEEKPEEVIAVDEAKQDEEEAPVAEEAKDAPVDQDVAFFNEPPDEYEKKKSMKGYFFKVALATFLLGLTFFAGIYYAVTNKTPLNLFDQKPTASPTHVTVSEEPTPKPVNLSLNTISVLNGTSVPGVAAKLKTQLTDAGFKVGTTGNADKATYTTTEIAANKKVEKAYLEKLKEILKKTYTLGTTSVLASGDADVVVTIGSQSAK